MGRPRLPVPDISIGRIRSIRTDLRRRIRRAKAEMPDVRPQAEIELTEQLRDADAVYRRLRNARIAELRRLRGG